MTRKDDPTRLWRVLKEQEIEDDVEEVLAMSDAELDQFLAANGGDPAQIRASGAALAKELLERRERLEWQSDAHAELEKVRSDAAAAKTKTPLPRPELLRRLAAVRTDPRFASPVVALFHKKSAADSTDEELQTLLDQIEFLAGRGTQ